jgi:hypothetical protein
MMWTIQELVSCFHSLTMNSDGKGTCSGTVTVGVPRDRKATAIDSGQAYSSTTP